MAGPGRDDLGRLGHLFAQDAYDQLAVLGGPATAAPRFIQHWDGGDLVVGAAGVPAAQSRLLHRCP